jgi:bacillithiol system protein YtxJ
MNWVHLDKTALLNVLDELSCDRQVIIFKHSTRCEASRHALRDFEKHWKESKIEDIIPYYLDVLKHRDVSDEVKERYNVKHESPQLLIISNGICTHSYSHSEINFENIMHKEK